MRQLIVLSGSGISADSGVDTFRASGSNSLWKRYDPGKVCNFECWESNLDEVHEFYSRRREEIARVRPNQAHRTVVSWQKRYGAQLITQNVDDLFERAGASDVLHVHGFLTALRCFACGERWDCGYQKFDPAADRCPHCGDRRRVKPDVVFFGEPAPLYAEMWRRLDALGPDDVLAVIGTSGAVLPIGQIAQYCPATSILSNLAPEPLLPEEDFDHVMHGRAAEMAEKLDRLVTSLMEAC